MKPPLDKKGKSKEKGKDKQKQPDKGKGKESQQPTYDYLDGLVHDVALKAELLKGYEQFKVHTSPRKSDLVMLIYRLGRRLHGQRSVTDGAALVITIE